MNDSAGLPRDRPRVTRRVHGAVAFRLHVCTRSDYRIGMHVTHREITAPQGSPDFKSSTYTFSDGSTLTYRAGVFGAEYRDAAGRDCKLGRTAQAMRKARQAYDAAHPDK